MVGGGSAPGITICFVGHSFHQRTRSSEFFISILRELGDVSEFYSSPDAHELDDDDLVARLATSSFDLYIFWQSDFIAERLHGLNLGRFVLVPMYDGIVGRPAAFWRQFVDCQFISFSRAHHEELQQLDCRSSYFQYWPEPKASCPERDYTRRDGFFWERRPDSRLNLALVSRLCRALGITDLHLHAVPDYKTLRLERRTAHYSRRSVANLDLSVSGWFDRREDLDAAAGAPLFFFAPRQVEGIGMAMLEAMGRGQIVVAPDLPTMNEYVGDGVTGILHDLDEPDRPHDLGIADLARISRAAFRKAEVGRKRWLEDVERLKSILLDDGRRWSSGDYSSHFLNRTRRAAAQRAFAGVEDGQQSAAAREPIARRFGLAGRRG